MTGETPPIQHSNFFMGGTRIFGKKGKRNSGVRVVTCFERLFPSTQKIKLGSETVYVNKKQLQKFLDKMPDEEKAEQQQWIRQIKAQIILTEWGTEALRKKRSLQVGSCDETEMPYREYLEKQVDLEPTSPADALKQQKALEALYRITHNNKPSSQEVRRVIKEAQELLVIMENDNSQRYAGELETIKDQIKQIQKHRSGKNLDALIKSCQETTAKRIFGNTASLPSFIDSKHIQTLQRASSEALKTEAEAEAEQIINSINIALRCCVDKIPEQGIDLSTLGVRLTPNELIINLDIYPKAIRDRITESFTGTGTYVSKDVSWGLNGVSTFTIVHTAAVDPKGIDLEAQNAFPTPQKASLQSTAEELKHIFSTELKLLQTCTSPTPQEKERMRQLGEWIGALTNPKTAGFSLEECVERLSRWKTESEQNTQSILNP